MARDYKRIDRSTIWTSIFYALLLAINVYWISATQFCLRSDSARHAFESAIVNTEHPSFLNDPRCILDHRQGKIVSGTVSIPSPNDAPTTPGINFLAPTSSQKPIYPFPNIIQRLTSPLISICGYNVWPFFIVESIFVAIAIVAVYISARQLRCSTSAYLATSALIGSIYLPLASRSYTLDYPMASIYIAQLAMYLLYKRYRHQAIIWALYLTIPTIVCVKYQAIIWDIPLFISIGIDIYRELGIKRAIIYTSTALSLMLSSYLCLTSLNDGYSSYIQGHLIEVNVKLEKACLSPLQTAIRYLNYLKNEITAPPFFFIYFPSFILFIRSCYRHPQERILLIPLMTGPILFITTEAAPRWFAPLWPLRCLVIAIAWGELKDIWPQYRKILISSLSAFFLFQGLVLNGGWLLPLDIVDRVPALCLSADYDRNYFADIDSNKPLLFDMRSRWSGSLLFSFEPYKNDWKKALSPLLETIPSPNALYHCAPTTSLDPCLDYELTAGCELTSSINFLLYELGHPQGKHLTVILSHPPASRTKNAYLLITQPISSNMEPKALNQIYPELHGEMVYHSNFPNLDISCYRLPANR